MRNLVIACSIAFGLCAVPSSTRAGDLTAPQILEKVDDVLYEAKDKKMTVRFVLVDKGGQEKTREMEILEKGNDSRLMKFTAPADQKGIGFLSLPNEVLYLYLPAFGKTRRIAAHVKNQNFAGSDLSFENLEAKRYSSRWDATFAPVQEPDNYVLELRPKPGTSTEYSKLVSHVRKDCFYSVKVEYFDKSGEPYKVFVRNKVEKVDGKYWEARESVMTTIKTGHSTKLLLDAISYDNGLTEEQFSERYLMR